MLNADDDYDDSSKANNDLSSNALRAQLKQRNLNAARDRPDENALRQLDSSLKKNTAFVRRLKTFTETQADAFVKDFMALNLTRYVAEMVNSICEAKLKPSDVSAVLRLCSLAHQRYGDFAAFLLDYFKKVFAFNSECTIGNQTKFCTDLRLMVELVLIGVLTEKEAVPILLDAVAILTRGEREDKFAYAPGLFSFCKHFRHDLLNIPSSVDEKKTECLLSAESRQRVTGKIEDYYELLLRQTKRLLLEMTKAKQKVTFQLQNRGDVNPKCAEQLEELTSEFSQLKETLLKYAELLERPNAKLMLQEEADRLDSSRTDKGLTDESGKLDTPLWDSDETRMFYESYPNLEEMLPPILLVKKSKSQKQCLTNENELEAIRALEKEISERSEQRSTDDSAGDTVEEDVDLSLDLALSMVNETFEEDTEEDAVEAEQHTSTMLRENMDTFLVKLPNLINRDMIDQAAVEFATNLNCKTNRKRLLKALCEVHRNRLDLLPFYGRLIAILSPVVDGLGNEVSRHLMGEFRRHMRKNDQVCIESKVKVVRYIGELVKFRIFAADDAICCFRLLLIDLRHHSIDMACNFLETCGCFLLHQPETQLKTKGLLEVMKRRVSSKIRLEPRHESMIHNAYYACFPPEAKAPTCVVRLTPGQKYIKHLLHSLKMSNLDEVVLQLRKIDWTDKLLTDSLLCWLSQPYKFKFNAPECFACLLSGLVAYHAHFCQRVIDNILEQMRLDMEEPETRMNNLRRRSCAVMLSKVFVYQLVDPVVIFNTLYLLITFEIMEDGDEPAFRVYLVCEILQHCGEFFNKGADRHALDAFLLFFQRYWMSLPSVQKMNDEPASLDRPPLTNRELIACQELMATVRNTIAGVRSKFRFAANWEEADKLARDELERHQAVQPENCYTISEESDDESLDDQQPTDAFDSTMVDETEYFVDEKEEADDEVASVNSQPVEEQYSGTESSTSSMSIVSEEESTEAESLRFSVELNRLINDMIQQRINEQPKAPAITFPPPAVDGLDLDPDQGEDGQRSSVKFVLMSKNRQSKPVLKTLEVPRDSEIARNFLSRAADELREKERMKQLTLNMSKRIEEEETDENGQSTSKSVLAGEWHSKGGGGGGSAGVAWGSTASSRHIRSPLNVRDACYTSGGW